MSFKTEDENKNKESEDNFGLPDLDYKPLDQLDEPSESKIEPIEFEAGDSVTLHEEQPIERVERVDSHGFIPEPRETKSNAPIIIGLLIGAVVLVASFMVWKYVIQPNNLKAQQEKLAKEKALKDKEAAQLLAKQKEEEEERQRLAAEAAANAKPAIGTIEALTAPTRRYYVVVSSAIDADLAMDYAKKLSEKGVSSKIIPPFGKSKFSRLAIADHDSYASAQSNADAVKADFGNAVWVIRY
jgi:cytoskeletal protein RodZ